MTCLNSSKNGDFRSSNLTDSVPKKQKNGIAGAKETLDRISQLPDSFKFSLFCRPKMPWHLVLSQKGCPALETLELSSSDGFCRLEITSSNLKRLMLNRYWWFCGRVEDPLEIIAPYLQHLEILGDLDYLTCRLVNVSSLINARLTFSITCITDIWGLDPDAAEHSCANYHQNFRNLVLDYLQKLSYATELIIGRWLAELNSYRCQLELSYLAKGDIISLQSWISNIVFPNLKNVKVVGCIAECFKRWFGSGNDKLFELSEFLLKNAMTLKKFVVVSERRICRECLESCESQYLSRLARKLLGSPRSSMKFVIIYQESEKPELLFRGILEMSPHIVGV